jgi:hypothetical protein
MEVDMEAAHAKTTHERDNTKAMAMKRILAKFEGTKVQRGIIRFVLRWVSRSSVFLPFITRGKRFFDAVFNKVVSALVLYLPMSTFYAFPGSKNILISW